MKKVTKKELVERANEHELAIFQIKKALEQNGIKWTEEPKLKQLDQSVFDGLPSEYKWVARDRDGDRFAYAGKPHPREDTGAWADNSPLEVRFIDAGYDDVDWQNSLIERDTVELTGSDLARAMLARGDSLVMCKVSDRDDAQAKKTGFATVILVFGEYGFEDSQHEYKYAIPINNQGEPLTQSEAGL